MAEKKSEKTKGKSAKKPPPMPYFPPTNPTQVKKVPPVYVGEQMGENFI